MTTPTRHKRRAMRYSGVTAAFHERYITPPWRAVKQKSSKRGSKRLANGIATALRPHDSTPPGRATPARRLRLTVLAFLFALALSGCHGVKLPAWVPGPATPAPRLAEQAQEVEQHARDIADAARLAWQAVQAMQAQMPEPPTWFVDGVGEIQLRLEDIARLSGQLQRETAPAIIDAGHKVDAIAGERDAASKAAVEQSREVARLREDAASGLRRWLVVLGALALAGMVLSGAGVWFAPTPGMKRMAVGGLIFCGVTFAAAAALHRYYEPIVLIATIGLGVAVLLAIGYGIYLHVGKRKAVVELVETIEAVKTELPPPVRTALFAQPTDAGATAGGAVYQIQSPSTVKEVAAVRADMAAAAAAVQQP